MSRSIQPTKEESKEAPKEEKDKVTLISFEELILVKLDQVLGNQKLIMDYLIALGNKKAEEKEAPKE